MLQKFLFGIDRSDDPRPQIGARRGRYHDSYRPRRTKEEKERRKRLRERYQRKQLFFFGQKIGGKRNKNFFYLFPDIEDYPLSAFLAEHLGDAAVDAVMDLEVSTISREQYEEGQAIIRERCEAVQKTWSPNKLRKRNCFYVAPMRYQPVHDDLKLDNRDGGE